MEVVVDTNVVAYLLRHRGLLRRAKALTRVDPMRGPLSELSTSCGCDPFRDPASAEGPVHLNLARRLGIESVNTTTLCQGALLRSVSSGVAVYDTLFVELASRTGCPLVTFDKAVIKAFPEIAIRPRDLPKR